jgi:hypothetical protein
MKTVSPIIPAKDVAPKVFAILVDSVKSTMPEASEAEQAKAIASILNALSVQMFH